jgi:hypothetical protein
LLILLRIVTSEVLIAAAFLQHGLGDDQHQSNRNWPNF